MLILKRPTKQPDQSLIVAVSGAQSVGKTTFCLDLRDELQRKGTVSVEVRTRVARDLKAKGIASDQFTDADEYPLYFRRHFENLLRPSAADVVILDRSVLDTIAYAQLNGNVSPVWLGLCERLAELLIPLVHMYFYIPVEFGVEDDGIRCTDNDYQSQLATIMETVIKAYYPTRIIMTGSREQRVQLALRAMTDAC
jgi:thymidylate kinase